MGEGYKEEYNAYVEWLMDFAKDSPPNTSVAISGAARIIETLLDRLEASEKARGIMASEISRLAKEIDKLNSDRMGVMQTWTSTL